MKTFVEPWRRMIKEINDVIEHSMNEGLPLSAIELNAVEWKQFVIARTTTVTGKRLDDAEFDCGTAMYRGIKVFKGSK